ALSLAIFCLRASSAALMRSASARPSASMRAASASAAARVRIASALASATASKPGSAAACPLTFSIDVAVTVDGPFSAGGDAGASVQAGGFALAGGRMGGEPVEQVLAGPGGLPGPCGLGAAVVVGAAGAALGLVAPGHQATLAVAGL